MKRILMKKILKKYVKIYYLYIEMTTNCDQKHCKKKDVKDIKIFLKKKKV